MGAVGATPVPREGWTYLIQSIDGGPVKIGFTRGNPDDRLKSIQTNSPDELRIIARLPGIDLEPILHERYAADRIRGEWFDGSVAERVLDEFSSPVLRALRGESLLRDL
jgi:hypothetical protein